MRGANQEDRGPAIIVMAKAPVPGSVKTRLAGDLAPHEIVALARCFIADTVLGVKQAGAQVFVAYAPEGGRELIEPLTGGGVEWILQRGADLGARMLAAFTDAAKQGYAPLVMVGTDSPNMPMGSYREAIDALRGGSADVILGRAADGGYYLIGVRAIPPRLLADISWSGPEVFEQTAANAAWLGLRVGEVAPWYDVDTIDDLRRLREDLLSDPDGASRAPATFDWLRSWERPSR